MHDKTLPAIALAALLMTAAWFWGGPPDAVLPATHPLWQTRQEGLYLSGLLAIGLMSLAMFLATRSAWLETPFGGLDRLYRLHKWLGIGAGGLALAHWLVEMADDVLKATIGRSGRVPRSQAEGIFDPLRDLAEETGEWAIYVLLALLALTLWRRFPYRPWRQLHRAMPLLYLMLALHAVLLAPASWWQHPVGWLLGGLLALGSYGAVRALFGTIGRIRRHTGTIVEVASPATDLLRVRCRMGTDWPGHRPGQFALVTFHADEGAHPFTVSNADAGERTVEFHIKALGDYTRTLASRLSVGDPVGIEGPYGRFIPVPGQRAERQTWIAGGIGITPFLAWLEALRADPAAAPTVDLHYCSRHGNDDPLLPRLRSLCETLPTVRLQVHGNDAGRQLLNSLQNPEHIWFCGPSGLAELVRSHCPAARLHQEAFVLR